MSNRQLHKGIEELLLQKDLLSVEDFVKACPGTPKSSVYTRIRSLVQGKRLVVVGRGQYRPVHKPEYTIPVTDWMMEVNRYLIDKCVGIDNCISTQEDNLVVEVAKSHIATVVDALKGRYPKVVLKKDADRFPSKLEGYIIVGQLISDAPLFTMEEMYVPSLEKHLIDGLCEKKTDKPAKRNEFQRAMEVYPVNMNKLHRYATRRGVSEELKDAVSSLDNDRIELFSATQKYLSTIPVTRAWVFGSFARGEETPSSDLDLLVDYDKASKVSLLDIVRYKLDLEKIIGREVDLISNGSLKPFAVPSAERDKYLIYER